jgi:bifunctional DNA-binding transcriptional regulator/antitoxin component of YhaV-PrlF toxin-antitoxin module
MINEANFIGTVKAEGRVTIPETVRKALNIKPEDLVQIKIKKITS